MQAVSWRLPTENRVNILMLHSVAVGKLQVRDRKSELPTCLDSDQLGTFNSERVAKWTKSIYLFLIRKGSKNKKAYEEMKVFLSVFHLLSKVKAAKHTSRRWCFSSDIPTGKYEKTDRANEFYKSETQTSDNSDQYRTQHKTGNNF